MRHTKYHNLVVEELLAHVEDARAHSDIIEELSNRLENKPRDVTDWSFNCPVCEAVLKGEVDVDDDDCFEVKAGEA